MNCVIAPPYAGTIGLRRRRTGSWPLLLLSFIVGVLPVSAQIPPLVFDRISVDQGLSQSIVVSIIQDARGFLWFGTEDGLNLYDGYSFTILRSDPSDQHSLSYNQISCIHEDARGVIWVGTFTGGLNRYILRKNRFVRYHSSPLDSATISSDLITAITSDLSGAIWIGTDRGLCRMTPGPVREWDEPFIVRFHPDPRNPLSLPHDNIRSLCIDSAGALWVGTDRGLACLREEELSSREPRFLRYQSDSRDITSLSQDTVRTTFVDRQGILWVGTDRGLNRAIGGGKHGRVTGFERFLPRAEDPFSLNDPRVCALFEDNSGILWVGTDGGGLSRLDPETRVFYHYLNDPRNSQSLSYNEIRSIYQDRSGLLWVGTYGGGVNKVDPRKKPFLLYRHDPNNSNSLNQEIIWAIHEDPDGNLWVGTHGGGLNRIDRKRNRYSVYRSNPADPTTLSNDIVRLVVGDPSGDLWIGTHGGGLCRFTPQTGKFRRYLHDPADSTSISHNEIRSLYLDRHGKLWIGTFGGGLNVVNTTGPPSTRLRFTRFRNDPADSCSIGSDFVREICEDSSGIFWIGTQGNGLNRFDPRTGCFTRYRASPGDPASLSSDHIMGLYLDGGGILWLATWGGGLNRFDPASGKVQRFMRRDGLPGDAVYGILEDRSGNLWLSTNYGLSRFNPRTLETRNYSIRDGLQSNEFDAGAYFHSPSGEMFFGGINGFNAFYPDSILDNPHIPAVVITSFRKLNREVRFDRPVSEVEEITLSYRDYVFSFEFAALDYTAPEKNRYAFMMEGLDEEWTHTTAEKRFVQYTTLKPGEYAFRVKGSNNDGVWNEEGVRVRIHITPPLWERWWIRTGVILAIGLVGAVLYRRRLRAIRMKAELRAAHDAQMSIMPHDDPRVPGCDVSGICVPANEVGGDFFDYFWLGEGDARFGIVIGDVSGKAMRAAMTAVMASGIVNAEAHSGKGIAEILRMTNRLLFSKTDRRMFTALCLLVLEPDRRSVSFGNAGLIRPILIGADGPRSLEAAGSPHPLGMVPETDYMQADFVVSPGDVLLLQTDGLTEAQNHGREFYGEERLHSMLRSLDMKILTSRQIRDALLEDVRRFVGSASQHDDMTVVVVKIL
jgi:ligand-binding sensor domain-containing protein/serine phosphatase RsbU (regulator of sigma subunit)